MSVSVYRHHRSLTPRDLVADFPLLEDAVFHPDNKEAINAFFAGQMEVRTRPHLPHPRPPWQCWVQCRTCWREEGPCPREGRRCRDARGPVWTVSGGCYPTLQTYGTGS